MAEANTLSLTRAAIDDSGSPLAHAGSRNKSDAMAEAIASEPFAACFMHGGRRSRWITLR